MNTPSTPEQDLVTTEPQRRALDEMSQQLVQNLNQMIEEQNQRARAFALQQHSMSSLPEINLPDMPELESVARPDPAQPVRQQAQHPATAKPATAKPATAKPATAKQSIFDAPPLPFELPTSKKKPTDKESSGCSGWLIAVGSFILFILLKSCD